MQEMTCWMCGAKKKAETKLSKRPGIGAINEIFQRKRIRMFGHAMHITNDDYTENYTLMKM